MWLWPLALCEEPFLRFVIAKLIELIEVGGATTGQQLLKSLDELASELYGVRLFDRDEALCALVGHIVQVDV